MPRIILLTNSSDAITYAGDETNMWVAPASPFSQTRDERVRFWQMQAFSDIQVNQVEYASKSQLEEIIQVDDETDCLFLMASTALIHREVINKINNLASNTAVIAVATCEKKSEPTGIPEIGLIRLDRSALSELKLQFSCQRLPCEWELSDVLALLGDTGLTTNTILSHQAYARTDDQFKLASFVLGTKAETLSRLQYILRRASIPRLAYFTASNWETDFSGCIGRVQSAFPAMPVAVRSSSRTEDSWQSSQAGAYDSILNVNSQNSDELRAAIDKVFASYGDHQATSQVVIQEMLLDVEMSGVLFTRSLSNGAPYYVINFDDKSGKTDSVTSGVTNELRTMVVYRNTSNLEAKLDPRLFRLIEAVREIEQLLDFDALDIEFAIDKQAHRVHILQVRPLIAQYPNKIALDEAVQRYLNEAQRRLCHYEEKAPHLIGNQTIFGVMPDANPAELIGIKAKPLATSLYRLLITEDVVGEERAKYGYIDIRPSPLMISIAGHPYVDARTSFNSFTPARLDKNIAEKLINSYIENLRLNPSLHDKVEFEIAFTCWFADLADQVEARYPGVFSATEISCIETAFSALTLKAIETIDDDVAVVEKQKAAHDAIIRAHSSPLNSTVLLMEIARRSGTGIFVRLARSGFVAITLLKSFVRCGFISQSEMDGFIASLNGVTSQIEELAVAVRDGSALFEDLVELCGHLRPGTYDITSSAYFEDVDAFIRPMVTNAERRHKHGFTFRDEAREIISKTLRAAGIDVSFDSFEKFCRKAIEGREYSKFVYTNTLSHSLRFLQEWGVGLGLTREDLAYLEWGDIVNILYGNICADEKGLNELIANSRRQYTIREALELPILISQVSDLFFFEKALLEPNYITQKKILAEIVVLDSAVTASPDLKHKIIMIPCADPGYDWLFSQQIGGLITMYGGANSHMAIRSAELRLPAAIGVGEMIYSKLTQATTVSLNCEIRSINVIN